MGRVFKKNQKRAAERVEEVTLKKKKKEEIPEPEEVEDEEEEIDAEDEEELEDEEGVEQGDDDEDSDISEKIIDINFEAYPLNEDDRDGIVDILTQTFLRTDVDLKGMAEALISQQPYGLVITSHYDELEDERDAVVYGVCSTIPVNGESTEKFAKDIVAYLTSRAKKSAEKEFVNKLEVAFKEPNTTMFVNDRMLNFPSLIVPQTFGSIRDEFHQLPKQPKHVVYIQKIRIVEGSEQNENGETSKPKRKMGKAEKKRAAAAALASAEIEFDNPEDELLFGLKQGSEMHFDFPVHMDVEPGSKFHIVEKDGKKWNPYRRIVIMDVKRFDAFLKRGIEGI